MFSQNIKASHYILFHLSNDSVRNTIYKMTFAHSALFALLALPSVLAASGVYNYDPDSPYGPSKWGDVDVANNQCSGQKNSPIAVTTIPCTTKADYTLTVRKVTHNNYVAIMISYCPVILLFPLITMTPYNHRTAPALLLT